MIDGIDMLFAVICLILIFLLVEAWERYFSWSEWDRDRRRNRKRFRYEFQDQFDEKFYREHLRLIFKIKTMTSAFSSLATAASKVNNSFNEFGKVLSQVKVGKEYDG